MKEISAVVRRATTNRLLKKEKRTAWLLLTPMLIYYTVFSILPVIFVFVVSFLHWQLLSNEISWAGLDNFRVFFTEPDNFRSLINTGIMGITILVLNMGLGLLLALGLNKNLYLRGLQRAIWYIPVVISMAVISDILAKMLFPTANGTMNVILSKFGIGTIAWNQSTFWMFFWIIVLSVWKGLGTTILYFIAGLNAIPVELYEAAQIDGCNKFQKFLYVTMPGIRPMTSFILVTSLIGIFNIFEPVQLISEGGPNRTTEVIMFKIYNEMASNFQMGMSAAVSLIVTFIVFIITLFSLKTTGLKV